MIFGAREMCYVRLNGFLLVRMYHGEQKLETVEQRDYMQKTIFYMSASKTRGSPPGPPPWKPKFYVVVSDNKENNFSIYLRFKRKKKTIRHIRKKV